MASGPPSLARVRHASERARATAGTGLRSLYLIPRQAGRYSFTCADDDWAGMTGVITIH